MKINNQIFGNRYVQLCINLIIALALLMLARIIFIAYNYTNSYEGFLTWKLIGNIFKGGLRFDLSTLFYINGLYIVLYLLPLGIKEGQVWNKILKWEFIVTNAIALLINMMDCKYVQFTGRRSTATIFSEFEHEHNLLKIASTEILNNAVWILVFGALIWLVWKAYRTPKPVEKDKRGWGYYLINTGMLAVFALVAVGAIRGGVDRTTRPITLSDANKYVDRPIEAAAVLNTPFSIIRSMGKTSYNLIPYMSEEEASALFTPLHLPADSAKFTPKNVVILIVESFSRGFIGALNEELNDSTYEGYTPFADEMVRKSYTFKHSFANGMKSIDGMPSVLSSIPMMIEPFFLTPASMNDMGGIAYYLKDKGYSSAFFHGAPNGSMGFEAFARKSGFDKYYGLTEYNEKYPGNKDFDGSWAVWDEPFLQYFAQEMNNLPEPFVASVFTASSHHPFALPKEYIDTFPEEGNQPILKCIRYTDHALRKFFETAEKQPWYKNTLFVLTSDHSSVATAEKFATSQGKYASPIMLYAPGDSTLQRFDEESIAQQIDIMPTVLNYLGYDKPFVAFGKDVINTPAEETWAFNYNGGIYQYATGDYFIQFDGDKIKAIFDFKHDAELKNNLLEDMDAETIAKYTRQIEAFIQQYAQAMSGNHLLPENQ